jgi:opacity protein-like surface antigen
MFGGELAARADYSGDAHQNLRELYHGARAMAMGNAFVSIADDEEALFYNPAGLAGIESSTFQLVNSDLEISGDIVSSTQSSYDQFKNLSGDSLNILMGKDVYLHGNYVPTYVTKNFGFGVLFDQQLSLISQNKSLPQVEMGYQTTNGIQMGYAFQLDRAKKAKSDWRFGIGLKYLFRRGGYYTLDQKQIINMSQDELKSIVGGYGSGFGFDLGTQYIYRINHFLKLQAGAAWTEIGGVSFGNDTSEPVSGNLSAGLSVRYEFAHMGATLAYDLRHINQSVDARLRNHFGMELSIPMFKVLAGINEVYPTFGFGVDIGLVQLMTVSYAEEQSAFAKTNPERRYLLHIGMGF